jgi:hypothetical protein
MGNMKTKVIPLKIGTRETVSESCRQYLSKVHGNLDIKELQTTTTLGSEHKLRKVVV